MTRLRAVLLGIALGVGVGAPGEALTPSVTPILNCVVTNEAHATMDVYWGYASAYAAPVTIAAGTAGNLFSPGAGDRDQPETFEPGIHPRVFVTQVSLSDSGPVISWALDGNSASAEAGLASQACTEPFPLEAPRGPQGPPGPTGSQGAQGPGPGSALRTVTVQGRQSSAATCAANEAVIGGGGSCSTVIHTSIPQANGWVVNCKGTTETAVSTAICVRK